jgi:hypothetical protein
MTDGGWSTKRLIVLRRVTRAVADHLQGQLKDYLSALAPLFRPAGILGEYVQGGEKGMSSVTLKAFQELQNVYGVAAGSNPFSLPKDLKPPLEIVRSALELTKMDYPYALNTEGQTKTIIITAPLKWQLTHAEFAPARLRQLLSDRNRTDTDAARFVLHYSVLQVLISRQAGFTQILSALHYDLSSLRLPEFGELPIICLASSVPTLRPPDDVIADAVEISGQNAFEEVVDVETVADIQDPFKEQLLKLIKSHGG